MNKKILIIAAHPDDEVLGCGGIIARADDEGDLVRVMIMATGKTSRYEEHTKAHLKEIEGLYKETIKALKILGVKEKNVVFGGFPDQKLDMVGNLQLVQYLKKEIQTFKPDLVFSHHSGDYNLDHKMVFEATRFACRPCPGEHFPSELYSFEVLSSTEWSFAEDSLFCPNSYFEISKQIERKLAAIKTYQSELRPYPHPRSERGVEILARKRGCEAGFEFAEAFHLLRKLC